MLPWLLNAACLALMDAAIPMRCMFTSTIVALLSKTSARDHPTIEELNAAKSLHVLTFSSKDELLLAESEGQFSMEDWNAIEEKAKILCLGNPDAMIEKEEDKPLQQHMKSIVEERVKMDAGETDNGFMTELHTTSSKII